MLLSFVLLPLLFVATVIVVGVIGDGGVSVSLILLLLLIAAAAMVLLPIEALWPLPYLHGFCSQSCCCHCGCCSAVVVCVVAVVPVVVLHTQTSDV